MYSRRQFYQCIEGVIVQKVLLSNTEVLFVSVINVQTLIMYSNQVVQVSELEGKPCLGWDVLHLLEASGETMSCVCVSRDW